MFLSFLVVVVVVKLVQLEASKFEIILILHKTTGTIFGAFNSTYSASGMFCDSHHTHQLGERSKSSYFQLSFCYQLY